MYLIRTLSLAANVPDDIDNVRIADVILDDRCPGFFRKYEEAYDCCINNKGDIFEDGYYNYAVIIRQGEGLYRNEEEVQWFHFQIIGEQYDRIASVSTCERPDILGVAHSPTNILPLIIG